jgi:tripartite ATP-independent transporter DctM subunit
MTAAIIAFILTIILGVPIAYVLGLTALVYVLTTADISLFAPIPQRMSTAVQNYGLLAIPLFVFVGELMNSGGITSRLVKFAQVIVGRLRGGLAYVNVVANMFLASILGSANAQSAMMSKVMVPEMEKEGYTKDFSAALTGSSSLLGPIIPPSLPFIIYGILAEVSITGMFLAGIIPGICLASGFVILIFFLSRKYQFPKSDKSSLGEIFKRFLSVFPALLIPAFIFAGILSGAFTATESAAVAALIALLVGAFVYKELKWKDIPNMLMRTAITSSIVTFIVATASMFSWVLALERIPHMIGEFLVNIAGDSIVFLLLINILFLLVGMVLEGTAAMIILVPILLPAAIQLGIDPIQFGIIVCINLTIGLITPPVGTVLFITSAASQVSIERLTIQLIPFLIVAILVLILITYIPPITLWIPSIFN